MRAAGLIVALALAACSSLQTAETEGNPRLDAIVTDVEGSGSSAPDEAESTTPHDDTSDDSGGPNDEPADEVDYSTGGRQFLMALVEGSVPLDTVMSTDHGVVVWENENLTDEIPMLGLYCDSDLSARAGTLLEMMQASVNAAVTEGLDITCESDRCTVPATNQWSPTIIVVFNSPSEVLRIDAIYFIEGSMVTDVYLEQQLSDAEELRRALRDCGGCDARPTPP